jgi:SnoaL-like polyketide cyclase
MKSFVKNVIAPFKDATSSVEEVVQAENTVVIRYRNEATHAGEYLGIPATGRRVRWDVVVIIHTRDGKVVGMWSQADLYGIYQQIKPNAANWIKWKISIGIEQGRIWVIVLLSHSKKRTEIYLVRINA